MCNMIRLKWDIHWTKKVMCILIKYIVISAVTSPEMRQMFCMCTSKIIDLH